MLTHIVAIDRACNFKSISNVQLRKFTRISCLYFSGGNHATRKFNANRLTWIQTVFPKQSGLPQEIGVLSIASLLPAHLQLTPPNFHSGELKQPTRAPFHLAQSFRNSKNHGRRRTRAGTGDPVENFRLLGTPC